MANARVTRRLCVIVIGSLCFVLPAHADEPTSEPPSATRPDPTADTDARPEETPSPRTTERRRRETNEPPKSLGPDSQATTLEEIVVTARKRDEFLRDVPASVTALDAEDLLEAQIRSLDDLKTQVPNLTFYRNGDGQTAIPVIRGVSRSPFIYYDSGVGLYVDGVYMSRNAGGVLDVVDFDQVEVLRGPQGTLFGKNTVGGAISITTAKPDDDLYAQGRVRAGSFSSVNTQLTLNIPVRLGWLEDKLFSRFSLGTFNSAGYTNNTLLDEKYSDRNAINFYGALRFEPHRDVTLTVSGNWSRDHTRGLGGRCVYIENNQNPLNTFLLGLYPDFPAACRKSQPYTFESNEPGLADLTSYGTWGILDWNVGKLAFLDDVLVRLRSSWRQQDPRFNADTDSTAFPILHHEAVGGPGALHGEPDSQQQIQQEAQVSASALEQRLQLIGGVFAYWEQAQSSTTISLMPARLGFVPLGSITEDLVSIDNRDWALYGQATGELTTWASLTAGVRYTQERKELSRLLRIPAALLNNPQACRTGACPETFANFSDHATYGAWTPMASLALEAPESWLQASGSLNHVMPYFTYARGFSGGGFNGGSRSDNPLERAGFKPEYANSYEWGLKTVAFDERLAVNFAYFIMDRSDMQVPAQITESCPADVPDCIPEVRALTTNAAKGRTEGFELETTASPIRGMRLSGSVGYTDARYVDFPNSQDEISGEIRDRSGEQLPFVPEWTTHVSAEQTFDVPALGPAWLRGSLTPRLDWSYVSAVSHFAPEIRELTQPGYNLLNLRIPYDFNEDRSQIAFWATNLSDEVYFANALSFARLTGAGIRYYEPPRAFGVEITQRFF